MWQLKCNTGYSLFFEWQNSESYIREKYDVYIDGKLYIKDKTTNIFSIFQDTCGEIEVTVKSKIIEYQQVVILKDNNYYINIGHYLTENDLTKDVTAKIQAIISSAPPNATIFIPKGRYKITSIFLKSDLKLVFDKNVIFSVSTNIDVFPIIPGIVETKKFEKEWHLSSWEGNPLSTHTSIINGYNLENVSIIGNLRIEANSSFENWWKEPKTLRKAWRPKTVFLNNCTNVIIHGTEIYNSPSWTIHPYYCQNIKLLDIYINNPSDSPNTDGINPESCENIEINGCVFDLGDDCIAIKSGKVYMAQKHYQPSKNIKITNCQMLRGHGAVVIGSEISCGVYDIYVDKCLFKQTDRGLRIKTRRGRGNKAIIDGINFKNIVMEDVKAPITINSFYCCDPDGYSDYVSTFAKQPVDERTPTLGKFNFSNIHCSGIEQVACIGYGLCEQPIEEIIVENSMFSFAANAQIGEPIMCREDVSMKRQVFVLMNVKSFIMVNNKIKAGAKEYAKYTNVINVKEKNNECCK